MFYTCRVIHGLRKLLYTMFFYVFNTHTPFTRVQSGAQYKRVRESRRERERRGPHDDFFLHVI